MSKQSFIEMLDMEIADNNVGYTIGQILELQGIVAAFKNDFNRTIGILESTHLKGIVREDVLGAWKSWVDCVGEK